MDQKKLKELRFVFTALEQVPVEQTDGDPCVPHKVQAACFSHVRLQPLDRPKVVCISKPALALIGVDISEQDLQGDEVAAMLSASKTVSNAAPYAHCYCGHQFGMFAGQLGDGAATSIGEVAMKDQAQLTGVHCWELQFKGAGLTPYSR